MQVIRFHCPSCEAELRIRDADFMGRPVACPDCRQLLLVNRDESGTVVVERADQQAVAEKRPTKSKTAASAATLETKTKQSEAVGLATRWKTWYSEGGLQKLSPTTTVWVAAASLGALALVVLAMGAGLWMRSRPTARDSAQPVSEQKQPNDQPQRNEKAKQVPVVAGAAPLATKKRESSSKGGQKASTVIRPLPSAEKIPNPNVPASPVDASAGSTKPATAATDSSNSGSKRQPVVAARPVGKPVDVPPAKPKLDIAAALRQRIVRFEQPKPVPLRDIVQIVEEMLAVPIRGDKSEIVDVDSLLQTPVTFDLQNTTVGDVLKSILAKAKLTFEIDPDEIRLRKQDNP